LPDANLRTETKRPSPWKKFFAPVVLLAVTLFKFGAPILKFLPVVLKTGGTMILSIWFYAMNWGWQFAVGFVVLIFIHECGHLVAAKQFGLKVGAPVFIPFMGAIIALKEAPRDAWVESVVGIGGPIFGALGSAACGAIYLWTGDSLFMALAYSGCFLNLFNLVPIGFLDGGRIVTALSPWLWVVGMVVMGVFAWQRPSFILILILVTSIPRLWSLFRAKTDEEKRYFEVLPSQRVTMGVAYFGLAALLAYGMHIAHIPPPR
jgi:Zn-dependent protease